MTLPALPSRSHFTPDDLLELDDGRLYELVNGRLVEKQLSPLATNTASYVISRLCEFLKASQAGVTYSQQTFRCFPNDPDLVRRPDIAFVADDRLGGVPEEGHVPIAPDLAIEVVSPNDKIYELDAKLADYFAAGVQAVWVVNPKQRTLRIHRLDRTVTALDESDTLSGQAVLPGFSVVVKDLLPRRAAPAAAPPSV